MRFQIFATTLLAGFLLLGGCNRSDDNDCSDCVLLSYAQTQCADPWGYGADGSAIAVEYAVRDFFASRGVVLNTVTISGATAPVTTCAACSCPSGKTIYVLVNSADSASLISLGFAR